MKPATSSIGCIIKEFFCIFEGGQQPQEAVTRKGGSKSCRGRSFNADTYISGGPADDYLLYSSSVLAHISNCYSHP